MDIYPAVIYVIRRASMNLRMCFKFINNTITLCHCLPF